MMEYGNYVGNIIAALSCIKSFKLVLIRQLLLFCSVVECQSARKQLLRSDTIHLYARHLKSSTNTILKEFPNDSASPWT